MTRLVGVIQVCSRCGTRWNVRDRERSWCPRCQGALLAPPGQPEPQPAAAAAGRQAPGQPAPAPSTSAPPAAPPRFRWIAVRPGPPPPPRPRRRPLGPTPRYQYIPRWGLIDPITPAAARDSAAARKGASATAARAALVAAGVVLAAAAGVHVVRYLLLLINRTTLLPPFVAIGSLLSGVLVSLAAVIAVIAAAVVLTSWLIGRRAAAFAVHDQPDPRPEWALWVGCLIPVVNLVWAPVFVLELAVAERCHARQRGPVTLWWIGWVVSFLICGWATWTSRATDAQGIADNTVTMIVAYLAGLAVLVLVWRVFAGFFDKPVDRPQHRWVVVEPGAAGERAPSVVAGSEELQDRPEDIPGADARPDVAVESRDREPAA
ncbi:DUF4328 domain-containing protein [Mycolicibacterium sp.]|uniref:DUF4328 domain-containing protein n=1 Tax=Mycolicibacterium sp. TaxID=2320850 RepID=UPI0028AB2E41|nr:DUF4328 domain-containing protein [Mycolicibacterium sp.]